MKKRNNFQIYIFCALFAAFTAVCSQIQIPLPFTPVAVNLALLPVLLCGSVLGAKAGMISMIIYVLLGLVGVPVFTGFAGGFGILAGPTGGYIIGYIPTALIMGLLTHGSFRSLAAKHTRGGAHAKSVRGRGASALASIGGSILVALPAIAVCYALGTVWFMLVTGTGLVASLLMCVVPFIPGDIIKAVFAASVCEALRRPVRALNVGILQDKMIDRAQERKYSSI